MHLDAELEAVLHRVFGDLVNFVSGRRGVYLAEHATHLSRVFFLTLWRGIIELVFATRLADVGCEARAHLGHLVNPGVSHFV